MGGRRGAPDDFELGLSSACPPGGTPHHASRKRRRRSGPPSCHVLGSFECVSEATDDLAVRDTTDSNPQLAAYSGSMSLELQQRSVEYLALGDAKDGSVGAAYFSVLVRVARASGEAHAHALVPGPQPSSLVCHRRPLPRRSAPRRTTPPA